MMIKVSLQDSPIFMIPVSSVFNVVLTPAFELDNLVFICQAAYTSPLLNTYSSTYVNDFPAFIKQLHIPAPLIQAEFPFQKADFLIQ